jgi:hypothetical protein
MSKRTLKLLQIKARLLLVTPKDKQEREILANLLFLVESAQRKEAARLAKNRRYRALHKLVGTTII